MKISVIKSREQIAPEIVEKIIEFDRRNMKPILDAAGIEFPEEKRQQSLADNSVFIMAFDENEIAGYIEYCRSWNDADYIYISSIQIDVKHRNTWLLLRLLDQFVRLISQEDFVGFETNVQKANTLAVRLYRKIGFTFKDNPRNSASWRLRADKSLLETSPIRPLINMWREKTHL